MYKTSVYTLVNGDMQWQTHQKQQTSQKMMSFSLRPHRLTVNVLLNNIIFLMIFAFFDVSVIACRR